MEKTVKLQTRTGISLKIVKLMVKAYSTLPPTNETLSVWFPIDQMSLITGQLGKEEADGLRVYFGIYTKKVIDLINAESPADNQVPAKYENRVTVIFVSTQKVNGMSKDYFVETHPMIPENRGVLCPPSTACDCTSDIFEIPPC